MGLTFIKFVHFWYILGKKIMIEILLYLGFCNSFLPAFNTNKTYAPVSSDERTDRDYQIYLLFKGLKVNQLEFNQN